MARCNIPGVKLTTGKPVINRFDHSKCDMTIDFRIVDWNKFFWYAVKNHLDIKWWQWPKVLLVYCKMTLIKRHGLR